MLQIVSGACEVMRFTVEAAEVANNLDIIFQQEDTNPVSNAGKASAVIHTLVLGTNALGSLTFLLGMSTNVQCNIKFFEFAGRIIHCPYNLKATFDNSNNLTTFELLNKTAIIPLVRIIRTGTELGSLRAQMFIEMTEEERSKHSTPLYVQDKDTQEAVYIGQKPIDVTECESQIKRSLTKTKVFNAIEAMCKFVDKANEAVPPPRAVAPRPRFLTHSPSTTIGPAQSTSGSTTAQQTNDDPLNLLQYPSIPDDFHEDPILQMFVCAITQSPIRYVVADPTSDEKQLYEKAAITRWLASNKRSPGTGRPLSAKDLVVQPHVQKAIDDRLRFLSTQLKKVARNRKVTNQDRDNLENLKNARESRSKSKTGTVSVIQKG